MMDNLNDDDVLRYVREGLESGLGILPGTVQDTTRVKELVEISGMGDNEFYSALSTLMVHLRHKYDVTLSADSSILRANMYPTVQDIVDTILLDLFEQGRLSADGERWAYCLGYADRPRAELGTPNDEDAFAQQQRTLWDDARMAAQVEKKYESPKSSAVSSLVIITSPDDAENKLDASDLYMEGDPPVPMYMLLGLE